jgi:hypothetical protein
MTSREWPIEFGSEEAVHSSVERGHHEAICKRVEHGLQHLGFVVLYNLEVINGCLLPLPLSGGGPYMEASAGRAS